MDESQASEQRECRAHGAYVAQALVGGRLWSTCPRCSEEHARAAAENAAREARLAEERRRAALWQRSGVPERFQAATFDRFTVDVAEQAKARNTCRAFARDFEPTGWGAPWLIGGVGTGKTMLGCCVARAAIFDRGIGVRIVTPRQLVRSIRATWQRDAAESEAEVIESFVRPGLLVLDEVGLSPLSDNEAALLYDVVNERYEACRPVLLISNLSPQGLLAALGPRLFDRLRENARVLLCEWPSYRGRLASTTEVVG